MERRNVTRKEVAMKAGVSVSVVSRALNNSGYVAEDKKRKIIKLAEELGYYPNPVAMSLQQQRTKQILFYCKDIMNVYNIELYGGMVKEAKKRGYMVMINAGYDFNNIRTTMIDGVILPNEHLAAFYAQKIGIKYHLPVVSASYSGYVNFRKSIPIVDVDIYKVVHTAIDYLKKNGHKKIALAVPYAYDSNQSRILAWRGEMAPVLGKDIKKYFIYAGKNTASADLASSPKENVEESLFTEENFLEEGKYAAQVYLEQKSDATAILCFNDEFALGMMNELLNRGVKIPEDISLIGIDGISTRNHVRPVLTSVSLFPEKHGAKCAEILMDMIEGKKIKYVSHSHIKLIPGETVKKIGKS